MIYLYINISLALLLISINLYHVIHLIRKNGSYHNGLLASLADIGQMFWGITYCTFAINTLTGQTVPILYQRLLMTVALTSAILYTITTIIRNGFIKHRP